MKFFTSMLVLCLSALLLNACAIAGRSIRDVPQINAKNIVMPRLNALPNREMTLEIVDARRPELKSQSTELQSEIQRAATEALSSVGVRVSNLSPQVLTLTIQDFSTAKFQEGCVKIKASFLIPKKAKLGSESTSCFEMRSPLGGKISADITKAYEESLSLIFKNLDEALIKI